MQQHEHQQHNAHPVARPQAPGWRGAVARWFGARAVPGADVAALQMQVDVTRQELLSLRDGLDQAFFVRWDAGREERAGAGPLAYAAGRHSVRDPEFYPQHLGPNALYEGYADLLLRRSRAMQDDSPILAGACQSSADDIVGSNLTCEPQCGDVQTDEIIREAWEAFSEGVDPARTLTLRQVLRAAWTELFFGGECFAQFTVADAIGEHPRGPAVTLIDGERVPRVGSYGVGGAGMLAQPAPGNVVRQGVEMDAAGRPVAYHVLSSHPHDNDWALGTSPFRVTRVPGVAMAHVFRLRRPGQLRGIPALVTVLLSLRDVESMNESALFLARVVASAGVVVKGVAPGMPIGAPLVRPGGGGALPGSEAAGMTDLQGQPVRGMRPGFIWKLPSKDMDVSVLNADLPPPAMEMANRVLLQQVAAGLGISYAHMARNYAGTTYSAARQEELRDRRGYQAWQEHLYAQLVRPMYRRWLAYELTSGELARTLPSVRVQRLLRNPRAAMRCQPVYPGWDWVDPAKEAKAIDLELDMGVTSPQLVCAAKGLDFRRVLQQRLEAEKLERDMRAAMGLPAPSGRDGDRRSIVDDVDGADGGQGQRADESRDDDDDDEDEQGRAGEGGAYGPGAAGGMAS